MAVSFPLDLRFELLIGGVWTRVPTYERDMVEVETGIRDRASQTDPGSLSITINNRDGRFSPRNPMSPYYGKIGRNTRARLSVPGTGSYLELDGTPDTVSTPDAAALDITGDLDLRWEGEADWYAGGAQILIGKWGAAGNRSYHLRVQEGSLWLHTTDNGTTGTAGRVTLPAMPRHAAVRGTIDVDNGAGGSVIRLYWAPTLAGPWTQIGADLVFNVASVFSSSAPLTIAPQQLDLVTPVRLPVVGRAHKAEVRNGINGPIVAAPDFTAQAADTTNFVDSAGRSWTVAAPAQIRDRADLFVGEVSEWPQHWTPDHSDAWVPIEVSGILRRMGQGRKALDSTLRRRIPSYAPLAYWPMEEGQSATQAYSPIDGVPTLQLSNAAWSSADSLPSSKPLPTLKGSEGNLATMVGSVPDRSGGASLPEWSVEWVYRLDEPNTTLYTFMRIVSTGTVREWYIQSRDNLTRIIGKNASGAEVFNQLIATSSDLYGQWVRVRFQVVQDGPNVTWRIDWQDVGGDAGGYSLTFPGTSGRPTAVASPPDGYAQALNNMAIGHIAVFGTATSPAFLGAIDAWSGETAWARMARLAAEENVPMARIPGPEATTLVGPQTPDTLLTLLQAAADADGGLLLEDRTRPGLLYRERSSMYSQTPKLVLSYDQEPGLAAPLQPVDDDTAVRNDRTVEREGGSAARAVLEDGPLSVQDPPDGIGVYDDSVTLSLHADEQTEPIAYWRLHLGTVDAPRYPTVTVLLHKAPQLIPLVLAMTEGDLIRITDLPPDVGFGDVDLIVSAIHHQTSLYQWTVTLTCEPGEPWRVAVADGPVPAKAGTDGSQLAEPLDETETAVDVLTTAGPVWSPNVADTPVDWRIGGEVMTVVAPGSLLNTNPFFPTDAAGWTPENGSVAWAQDYVHPHPRARASLKITPNGTSATGGAAADLTAVDSITPGARYKISMWVYSPNGWSDLRPSLHWYTNAGTFISTVGNTQPAVPAGTWTYLEDTVTAPSTAGRARARARHGGTPSAPYYVWAVRVTRLKSSPVYDEFGRTAASSWGLADSGQSWTTSGGATTDYSVGSGYGVQTSSTVGVRRISTIPSPSSDVDVYADVTTSATATGGSLFGAIAARYFTVNAQYFARIEFTTGNAITLTVRKRVAAVETQLGAFSPTITHVPGKFVRVRFQVIGTALKAKVWSATSPEPAVWHIEVTDTDLTVAGSLALWSVTSASNTNVNPQVRFDTFDLTNPQTYTVTRSVNGVTKAHAAGTAVALDKPAIAAL